MTARKTLLDFTNLLSPNSYQKNDKIVYKNLKNKYGKIKFKPCLSMKKIDQTRNHPLD